MPTANAPIGHSHVFLGSDHDSNERRTWAVILLCTVMMVAEIVGGALFGSIALMADGLHMSTHAGALLLAALAYRYARRHALDQRFTFGTGKIGDLAGYTSAVVLAMIALLIAYEAVMRLIAPVAIDYGQAIAIAVLGLIVNLASVWLLHGGGHHHQHHDHHGHRHDHDHGHAHDHGHHHGHDHDHAAHGHHHDGHRDNNMRSAVAHVMADAAVSVLVIVGLLLGRFAGWNWMDPVAGLVGAGVILSWSYTLIRDTGGILVDMLPDRRLVEKMRKAIEENGDKVADLHLWRLGPGHLGAIVSIATAQPRELAFYRAKLAAFSTLSHLTIEVQPR
ncbi:CDF family Co(II)/Ni(II) efflux transporter DmeF [Labrys neptuniae]